MPKPDVLTVIPARLAATRLPNKPLAEIAGEPMIVHVWRRALAAGLGRVLVATDSDAIADAIRAVSGEAVLTRSDHENGSLRIAEAVGMIDPDRAIGSSSISRATSRRSSRRPSGPRSPRSTDPAVDIATLAARSRGRRSATIPNVVKIAGAADRARVGSAPSISAASRIPSGPGPHYHHIGLYAYRRAASASLCRPAADRSGAAGEARAARALEGRNAHRCSHR